MTILRTFTCSLTGDRLQIVDYNGRQICELADLPTPDDQEAFALCQEYLLS